MFKKVLPDLLGCIGMFLSVCLHHIYGLRVTTQCDRFTYDHYKWTVFVFLSLECMFCSLSSLDARIF